jgi:hypothetical protein
VSRERTVRRGAQEAPTGGDVEEHATQRGAKRLAWSVVEKVPDQRWFRILVVLTTMTRIILTTARFIHDLRPPGAGRHRGSAR